MSSFHFHIRGVWKELDFSVVSRFLIKLGADVFIHVFQGIEERSFVRDFSLETPNRWKLLSV